MQVVRCWSTGVPEDGEKAVLARGVPERGRTGGAALQGGFRKGFSFGFRPVVVVGVLGLSGV